jgi:hypothetical protein
VTRFSTALLAAFLAACSAVSVPEIALDLANPKQPSVVVSGLSPSDLGALERAKLSPGAWAAAFRVSVVPGGGVPEPVPVAGQYTIAGGTVRFTPMYPFDPGRSYEVVFTPSAASGAGLDRLRRVSQIVRMPEAAASAPVSVTAVYPTGPSVPANLLRMYVEFSGAMGTRSGQDYITIVDAKGAEMSGALLPLDTELWNGDHTRFTILFDPGRVKRGILPNRAMGRPLHPGDTFTIVVGREWPDAHSRPLASELRKQYRVGPAVERPLSTTGWKVTAPGAGSRDALRVTFPAPLDHGLVRRALSVIQGDATLSGEVSVANGETEWRFVPRDAWQPGTHVVSILPVLEDPAGNRIGHAFETLSPDDDTRAGPTRVAFTIR